jgi:hypothetical protein
MKNVKQVKQALKEHLKETGEQVLDNVTKQVLGNATDRVDDVQTAIETRLRHIVQTVTASATPCSGCSC